MILSITGFEVGHCKVNKKLCANRVSLPLMSYLATEVLYTARLCKKSAISLVMSHPLKSVLTVYSRSLVAE